jgi:hypothetical protein
MNPDRGLAQLRAEPELSEAAVRGVVADALRKRTGPGPPPRRALAEAAARRIASTLSSCGPAAFVGRRRADGAIDTFARSRLAHRLFSLARRKVTAIGRPSDPFDVIVEGRDGRCYGVCLVLKPGAWAAAARAFAAGRAMALRRLTVAPVVFVFSLSDGSLRRFERAPARAKGAPPATRGGAAAA